MNTQMYTNILRVQGYTNILYEHPQGSVLRFWVGEKDRGGVGGVILGGRVVGAGVALHHVERVIIIIITIIYMYIYIYGEADRGGVRGVVLGGRVVNGGVVLHHV